MANFVVVIDPDRERRARFINTIKPLLAPVDGLATDTCSTGDFCAIWAAEARAPISQVADEQGAAVIWGEAVNGPGPERVDAEGLRRLREESDTLPQLVFDGFYAAAVYHSDSGLIVGADLLGIFPVYYYTTEEVALVGSSPALFRYHPAFRTEFDPEGLVGILLTMHMFDGHTLLRGVRRLAAGHVLVWHSGRPPKEVLQYELPASNRYYDLPFSAHVNMLDRALDETITRHAVAGNRYSQLLSGGLDSRMIAGYLNEKGIDTAAVTLGLRSDVEMGCAIPVARTLGFDHRAVDVGYDQYPFCADLQAKWEHVTNGFNFVMNWGIYPHLRELAPRIITGHAMDGAVGTRWIEKACAPSSTAMSFETFFSHVNGWGIRPDMLKKLLRREVFGDLVEEKIARMRAVYESYSESESQRAWCFNLHHRQRFHVGGAAWALSFGAWPVLPALDRQMLETGGAMPAATIAERRAEKELLCARFPQLAKLPLDHNSYDIEPLRPRLRRQVAQYLYWHLTPVRLLGNAKRKWTGERRYYYRIYDFNGPGWGAVRRQAEPCRERVLGLFHREAFEELLPGPGVPLQFEGGITDASGLKSLLGFLLWAREYL